tara:strand:+ start:3459 stop:4373 length:915 start_codon:yes stop_codon:yes gene_type:complete
MSLKVNLKILFFIIIFQIFCNVSEVKIVFKIDNEIITNIDVENEIAYLKIQNSNLDKLNETQLIELSKNSLIKQIIKKREIFKYFDTNQNPDFGNKLIKQNYLEKGFKNKKEFEKYLKGKNLEYEVYKEKILTEKVWNSIIYEKYKNKIKIDDLKIKKKVRQFINNQEKILEYNLSEIMFGLKVNYKEIKNFIDKYGFDTAAIKYSISDTSSNGGKIGWIKANNLSDILKNHILNLKEGEISKPLSIPNGNLLIKINKKRLLEKQFDFDEEVKKQIIFEQNRQLNILSLNFFKKLKQNTNINEY